MGDAEYIERCKTAYIRYLKGTVIDLDKGASVKSTYQIHRLETLVREFNGFIPPNRRSEFIISFLKKGSGKRTIGCSDFPLKKNTISIVPSRAIMSSIYDSVDVSGYVLMFNIDLFLQNGFPYHLVLNKKVLKASLKPFVVLNDGQAQKVEQLLENILEEHNELLPRREEMLTNKILELLILCDRYFSADQEEGVCNPIIERFTEEIERHFTANHSVKFYASLLNLHPNFLNNQVKKLTGLTAKQTINNRIVLEAKYLLYSSSMKIKEIAYELGFEDPNYFISFFKKAEQISPAQFRIDAA
jgi:AraC family transcriptional regulator, transcriptional activator of pobA